MTPSRGIRPGVAAMTAAERFWRHVQKTRTCWRWTGAGCTAAREYGRFQPTLGSHKLVQAHRFAYELLVGPIPDGLQIDHLCRNRWCVNPAHMEPVTARINQHRSTSVSGLNAAKTCCPLGHLYLVTGRVDPKTGKRYCRECQRLMMAKVRMRQRELAGPSVAVDTIVTIRRRA